MNPGGPGWNDPPSLSYETHSQTTGRRNLLTKRVGLPDLKMPSAKSSLETQNTENKTLTQLDGSLLPPQISGPPPDDTKLQKSSELTNKTKIANQNEESNTMPTMFNPISSENLATNPTPAIFSPIEGAETTNEELKKSEEMENVDLETMDIDVVTELKNIVEKCEKENIFSKHVGLTILKKIDIFEKQLNDNKLPNIVKEKMDLLTKYVMLKKYSEAWDIHVALMCDHSSSVMQWMVGIKKLVSEAKKL